MTVTITPVNIGSAPEDGTGDTARDAFNKVNNNEALMGRKMGGGETDVSHSLSGAGEVVTYNDKTKPGQKPPKQ